MADTNLTEALAGCAAAAGLAPDVPLTALIQRGEHCAHYDAPVPADASRRISSDTLVYAASLAKQVVGGCFALTTLAGLTSPDDTLRRWFPELPSWSDRVTLRQLLSHTGALPEEPALLEQMRASGQTARTSAGMLAALERFAELTEPPGTSYSYSNIGYVCLARVVELASRESLNDFASERIFEPLGMHDTRFWPGPDRFPDGALPVEPEPVVGLPFSLGDGGLWTTARNYLQWLDAMNTDALGVAALVEQTTTLNDGSALDYGWGARRIEHNGQVGWSHGGSWPGIFAKGMRFPALRACFVAFTADTDIDPILRLTDEVQDLLTQTPS